METILIYLNSKLINNRPDVTLHVSRPLLTNVTHCHKFLITLPSRCMTSFMGRP